MNTLELKGGMIELIAQIKNKELLQHLYEIIIEVITETQNDTTILSATQEAQLDQDLKASLNPKNLVEHQVAIQKMSKWLNK